MSVSATTRGRLVGLGGEGVARVGEPGVRHLSSSGTIPSDVELWDEKL